MKKFIAVAILLAGALYFSFFAGSNEAKDLISNENLETIVSEYFMNEGTRMFSGVKDVKVFQSHRILGAKANGENVDVYVDAITAGYGVKSNAVYEVSKKEYLGIITLGKTDKGYKPTKIDFPLEPIKAEKYFNGKMYLRLRLTRNDTLIENIKKEANIYYEEKGVDTSILK